MARIQILKKLDGWSGPLLVQLSRVVWPRRKKEQAPRSILLLRPGGIGDAVLLAPALVALKDAYPSARISVLAEERNAAAFALCPAVDEVLHYDRAEGLSRAVGGKFDLAIDTEQWHRLSAVVARLTRAPVTVGFATNSRSVLFTHAVPYSHNDYEVTSFMKLLAPLGIGSDSAPAAPFLCVPAPAAARAAELVPDFPAKEFVAIFPGASIPERRWGAERFRRVADHLALRGAAVVVVGGEGDAEEGDYIVRMCRGVNLAGKTTLAETAAVIARSALLISGDSGLLHIAVGLGVPTVSLFGPGIAAKWGPRGEGHRVLNLQLPCSPCTRFGTTPPCPDKARCMSEIPVNDVVSAACELLERYRSPDL